MRIEAGKLNHLIALQSFTETQSASGHPTQTWSTYVSVWSAWRTLSGRERLAAQQVQAVMTHEVTIRYLSTVQPGHRILWGTRTFDIKDVRNVDEADEQIRMLVSEVISTGPESSESPSSSLSASPSSSASA